MILILHHPHPLSSCSFIIIFIIIIIILIFITFIIFIIFINFIILIIFIIYIIFIIIIFIIFIFIFIIILIVLVILAILFMLIILIILIVLITLIIRQDVLEERPAAGIETGTFARAFSGEPGRRSTPCPPGKILRLGQCQREFYKDFTPKIPT